MYVCVHFEHVITKINKKEIMDLKESKEKHMRETWGEKRYGGDDVIILLYQNIKVIIIIKEYSDI